MRRRQGVPYRGGDRHRQKRYLRVISQALPGRGLVFLVAIVGNPGVLAVSGGDDNGLIRHEKAVPLPGFWSVLHPLIVALDENAIQLLESIKAKCDLAVVRLRPTRKRGGIRRIERLMAKEGSVPRRAMQSIMKRRCRRCPPKCAE